MIKKISLLILAAMLFGPAFAQTFESYSDAKRTFKHEYRLAHMNDPVSYGVRLSIAANPTIAKSRFNGYTLKQFNTVGYNKNTLAYVYNDYQGSVHTTSSILAGFDVFFTSGCTVSTDLGFDILWREQINGVTGEKMDTKRALAIYLVPKFKYYYLTRPVVRLYGNIGLGAGLYLGFNKAFHLEAQCAPLGIEVGRDIYGFFEAGVGTLYCGGNVGIGYKF